MHLIEIHVYPHIEPKHHILNETELNIAEIHQGLHIVLGFL
jgi:hypothetical protein